ncbi:lipid II flippase MurJ, partial [Actinomyces sp. MRS3W]
MAAGTLTSRILGLVRNALLVTALGATASGAADAFNTANTVPTQLYNLLIGGILNAILVPQIVRALRQRNGEELVNRLLTAASLLIAAVAALLTVAAPLVIMLYASGLGRWQPLAFAFAFWCMPQIFFYGLYALWGQVLNARSSFGPYMWSPVLNNIISIVSILAYLRIYGGYTSGQDPSIWDAGRIALIGATTTLGIAAQALILYIPLVRSGFHPRIIFGVRGTGLGSMSRVALWALLGTGIVSLGDLAAINLGSRAVTAAESAAYADVIVPSTTMYANAQLVYMLPQSLITTSIITALFTRMSEKAAAGDREGVRDDLSLGLRSIAVFTVLFAAGIGTLAAPALQVFVPSISWAEANASAPILTVLAIGIVGQGIWFTMQRVMLAYADTKRLLIADTVVGIIPIVMCAGAYLLAPATSWMVWAAVGSATCQIAGFLTLVPLIRRHLPDLDSARVISTYVRLIISALPAVLVGLLIRRLLDPAGGSLSGSRQVDALVTILVAAVCMSVTYLVAARLLRVEELNVFFSPLSRMVSKLGRMLPGGLGRAITRLGTALAPTAPTKP